MIHFVIRASSFDRSGVVLVSWWAVCGGMFAGCATHERGPVGPGSPKAVKLDIDPAKAYVSLVDVPPAIARPAKSESPPLPERAAQPIAASKALIAEQRYTEAALELERAFRFAPNQPEIHEALAMLHWQAGNLERAKNHALQTIEKKSDSAVAHYVLGRCLIASGDRAGAMTEFRTALLCGDFGEDAEMAALCHFHLAEALAAEGYLSAALEQYEAFGRRSTAKAPAAKGELASLLSTRRGSAAEGKSRVLERLGRYDEAAKSLEPVVAASGDDAGLRIRHARLLMLAGRLDAAAAAVRSIASDDDEVLSLTVEIHERSGRPERAVEDLRSRAAARPSERLAVRLADLLSSLGKKDEASDALLAYLKDHPDSEASRRKLIEMLIGESRWVEALRTAAEGVRRLSRANGEWEAVVDAMGRDRRAVEAISASAADETSDAIFLYLCGRVASAGGRKSDAEAIFRRALSLDAKLIPARAALANLLLDSCDLAEAMRVAERANPDVPEDARLEYVIGRVHDRLDDTEKAEVHYRAATQLDRTDSDSMFALANLYRRTRRPLQAQRQLRVLLDVDPRHEKARELLALALLEEGKNDGAFQEYRQLLSVSRNPGTIARCKALLDEKLRSDVEARRNLLLDALNAGEPDAALLVAIAETFEDSDPAAAKEYYARAAALDGNDEEAALGVVRTDQRLLDFERAASGIEALLRCRPNQHVWRRAMYGFWGLLGQFDRAIADAREQASRTDLPKEQRDAYRESMVEMLREAGRGDEGIALLTSWASAEPNDVNWKRRLAGECLRQHRYEESARLYGELWRDQPEEGSYRDRLLEALRSAGRHDRAAQYLLEWMENDPDDERILAVLAHTLGDAGRIDDAVELITARLPTATNRELLQNVLVGELTASGRFEESVRWLEGIADELVFVMRASRDRLDQTQLSDERRSRRPNEPYSADRLHERFEGVRLRRVEALTQAGRHREAAELVDAALETAPNAQVRFLLLYRKSVLHRSEGFHEAADEAMKAALALRPGDESVNNDLAYNWIDRGVHLAEARPMIQYAVGRMPRQPAYLDTYGWLLYKEGDFAGAELWLTRSNRIRGGDDPVIHDHLGDVNWRLGRREKALEHWRRAVELIGRKRPGEFNSDDERRVRDETPGKIEDASRGAEPRVAPIGERPAN